MPQSLQTHNLFEEIWFTGSSLNHHWQLQHGVPSALVAEAAERILPRHISRQDPVSKSWTQSFLESPDQLLVLALPITDLC